MKTLLAGLAALMAVPAMAQQFASEFELVEVAPGIAQVKGTNGGLGGTVTLLTGDTHAALVDDGYGPPGEALVAFLAETLERPVDFVINTHLHGDHVGGNAALAGQGAVVFAHHHVRQRLEADPNPAGGAAGLPVVTYSDGLVFHLTGLKTRVHHVPAAHTDGDSYLHFPNANVIHAGDLLFHSLFPYIDFDNGGTVAGYLAAMDEMIGLADGETRIIPGHGDVTDRAGLQADRDMLQDAFARVQARVEAGDSDEDILAANPLADYHDGFNWNFITTERMTRQMIRAAR